MNTQKKRKKNLITTIIIAILALTGCTREYAPIEESLATPTIEGDGFAEPLPSDLDGILEIGAQTATALAAGVGDAPAEVTKEATSEAGDPTAVPEGATETAAPESPADATATPMPTVTATSQPTAVVGKPASYTLKKGEFPYCIARRFNVDPSELLTLNSLSSAQAQSLQPGLTLSIPQSGAAFPSTRALHAHPVSYTVPSNMTVYAIACYFGDVDPATIISKNNISNPNNVAAGTVLQID